MNAIDREFLINHGFQEDADKKDKGQECKDLLRLV